MITLTKHVFLKFLICLLIFLNSFTCPGQKSEPKASLNLIRKHSLELYCSPFSKAIPQSANGLESGLYGEHLHWYKNSTETGLKYGYVLHNRFHLKAGIGHLLSRIGSYDHYKPAGSDEPYLDTKSSVHALMFNLGVNFRLFGRGKFRSYLCFGGTFLQYLQRVDHNAYLFPDGTKTSDIVKNSIDNSGIKPGRGSFGLRFEYQLSRHFMLSLEPTITFGSAPIRWYTGSGTSSPVITVKKSECYLPLGIAYCF